MSAVAAELRIMALQDANGDKDLAFELISEELARQMQNGANRSIDQSVRYMNLKNPAEIK